MWLILAFLALGLLIGNLVGLTASSVVTSLLGLLFAFGGGSILAFMEKLAPPDRKTASQAIFAFSVACLIGVYSGIVVSEGQLLSPKKAGDARQTQVQPKEAPKEAKKETIDQAAKVAAKESDRISVADRKYLRSFVTHTANAIDVKYKMGAMKADQAYEQLFALVQTAVQREAEGETP